MGMVTGLLGIGGGTGGTSVPPAVLANIAANNNATALARKGAFNSVDATQNLLQALKAQKGLQNQSQVYNQLQDVAQGRGPDLAGALLAKATGTNVANTAATMAGARGASGNVGLMARQVGQAGANIQQQSNLDAATLKAQEQLGALGAAGNLATTEAQQQIAGTTAAMQGAQTQEQLENSALSAFNNAQVTNQGSVNSANAGIAQQQTKNQGDFFGGVLSGVGSALGLAEGGEAEDPEASMPEPTSDDEFTHTDNPIVAPIPSNMPASSVGRFFKGFAKETETEMPMDSKGKLLKALGGETDVDSQLRKGGKVPGKPKVGGAVNSYSNDTVNAKLSPGEIVLPRSVTQSSNPVEASARFVQLLLEKKKREGRA